MSHTAVMQIVVSPHTLNNFYYKIKRNKLGNMVKENNITKHNFCTYRYLAYVF